MSDILIRMEMPKDCGKCFVGDRTICAGACPLVELPEHGDLIDRDATMNSILGEPPEAHYPVWYAANVNEMPAIIPANKEETEWQAI